MKQFIKCLVVFLVCAGFFLFVNLLPFMSGGHSFPIPIHLAAMLLSGLIIFRVYDMFTQSILTMGPKKLPQPTQTADSLAGTLPQECPSCGKPFGDASFCTHCGKARQETFTYVIPIDESITAQRLEKKVNAWLANNPYIDKCNLQMKTKASLLSPFVSLKFFVTDAKITYTLSDKPRSHQYGMAFLYKLRLFGPIGYSTEKQVMKWQQSNPLCKIVHFHGGRIQHLSTRGDFHAQYYAYVFFKKER